jgi:hypothetical protein
MSEVAAAMRSIPGGRMLENFNARSPGICRCPRVRLDRRHGATGMPIALGVIEQDP